MKTFVQPGKTLTFTAPAGGVLAGNGYKIGDLFTVANYSAAEGAEFEGDLEGVFELPKAAGAIAEGVKVYWVTANANVTTTASGNTLIGHAAAAAADGASTVRVRLSN